MNSLSYWRMLITICGLLIVGCEKKSLLTEASTTNQEFENSVQKADVFFENFHEPVEFTQFFHCAGEEIHFSGSFHWNYHTVVNANGDFHSVFVANDHSLSGVGLTTGTKYHEVGATVEVFTFRGTAPFEYNFTITFDFIGQGPGNNVIIKENVHFIVNANGITTVSFDKFTQECK